VGVVRNAVSDDGGQTQPANPKPGQTRPRSRVAKRVGRRPGAVTSQPEGR